MTVLVVRLTLVFLAFIPNAIAAPISQPTLSSPQWTLQHWSTAQAPQTLAQQAANQATHPASITKLLTAYVTLQAVAQGELALDTTFTVSTAAVAQHGTRVGYVANESITVQQALQGMLAISGNDAAWALAERVGGSTVDFVARMNQTGQRLGLTTSQWRNPHGLTHDGHVSSAADLMTMAHALWRDFPAVRPWLGVKSHTWRGVTQSNRNSLLWRDATVDGLKTGHTDAAGYNLAASSLWRVTVDQDAYDWRLSSVVLGAASAAARATDSAALLAWGRSAYRPWRLYSAGDAVGKVNVRGASKAVEARIASAVWAVLPASRTASSLRYELLPKADIQAPLARGAVFATLNVYDGTALVASSPVLAREAVDRASWYARLWQWVKLLF